VAIGSPNLEQAVEKARERYDELDINLKELSRSSRNQAPEALATEREKRDRRRFLESLYDEKREAQQAYERIIAGNELQEVNFLPRGALVARTVLRVVLRTSGGALLGYGSGVLVGNRVLMTNNHVFKDRAMARLAEAQAYYEVDVDGDPEEPRTFAIMPDELFFTSEELDFSLVAVAPLDKGGKERLASLGWVPLIGSAGKASEGEWLNIVQHPKGERKQLCLRENQLLKRADDVLWYSTDTQGGSSGSPVFNNNWLMVALHHSGVPETKNGKWQTLDGRDYDPNRDGEDTIKWIANEGIRVSRIVQTLRDSAVAGEPLIRPILETDVSDIRARLPVIFPDVENIAAMLAKSFAERITPKRPVQAGPAGPEPDHPTETEEPDMTSRRVTLTLEIDERGDVSVVDSSASEADLMEKGGKPAKPKLVIDAPVDPSKDWAKGFDPVFLGADFTVDLPTIKKVIDGKIAPLKSQGAYGLPKPDDGAVKAGVLRYNGYSVVLNGDRRLAIFSAANINGGVEFTNITRGSDIWLFDDRVDHKYQIGNTLYAKNKIDRGHLTRREDMEWGSDPVEATRRANGTCTWANCAPQHALFNQDKHPDKSIRLWGGLEKYILEQTARHYQFRVQAFTGPIFDEDDPNYRGVKIPLDYWKVVVAVNADDELFATGYVLTQRQVLDISKLDEAAIEVPFGQFQTYQRPIAEIEEATGLEFTALGGKVRLRDYDPLARELKKKPWRRRRRTRTGATEADLVEPVLTDDAPLEAFEDLVLD
jgi:endonuclease G, mitochondrial